FVSVRLDKMNLIRAEFFEGKFRVGKLKTKKNYLKERTQFAPKKMNNPNPFVPKGSLLERQSKRRSRMKLGVFCVLSVGIAGLTAMLIQGCKRQTENPENVTPPEETNNFAPETNPPEMVMSNPPVEPSPIVTNPPIVTPTVQTPENSGTEYVVIKGDSFSKIAKKFGVTVRSLENANPGITPTRLQIGQKLLIPAASSGNATTPETENSAAATNTGETVYTVKSGDTLTKIARRHGTTVKAIVSENNLSTMQIKVGQKLKIPAKAPSAVPAPVAPESVAPTSTPAAPPGQ
ncbi:MAG: LysM peptidoglycan-binding domain-containing protein, partial [Limisphaerales bacterium]